MTIPTTAGTTAAGTTAAGTTAAGATAAGATAAVTTADVRWVHGVDPDAVAVTVQACPAVAGLHSGPFGDIATYLPGRRIAGVQIHPDVVAVGVTARWGVPIGELRAQIAQACAPLLTGQRVDVLIADIDVNWPAASPDAVLPDAVGPEAVVSAALLPEVVVPDALLPEVVVPDALLPEAVVLPEAVLSDTGVPEAVAPEASNFSPGPLL